MADKKPPAPKTMPGWVNFVIGGLSGMFAICVVQPMDLIKTRMQLAGPKGSIGEVVGGIMKSDGVFGFYNGLSAALFRQATNFGTPNLAAKIGLGSIAGGVGALIGNPAEIALIRMTADGRLPPDKRRNYKHVIDALARICREEGTGALMRGMTATVTRAMVVNGAQLSTYQQSREMLLARGMADGIPLHATCAMIAGLVTSAASLPVDIVKTRYNKLIPMTTPPSDEHLREEKWSVSLDRIGMTEERRGFNSVQKLSHNDKIRKPPKETVYVDNARRSSTQLTTYLSQKCGDVLHCIGNTKTYPGADCA
ncbi:unnamed protein product [Pieris brassicae]|uniref:Mitochondrial 2-oxoglutarate/malate carrier protein n=1 Tax=Pieris brassicae TaxID=7116 RepID=A0A9P0TG68_PIEBR|nr:unnamed protein product [Pieris brassicae]